MKREIVLVIDNYQCWLVSMLLFYEVNWVQSVIINITIA